MFQFKPNTYNFNITSLSYARPRVNKSGWRRAKNARVDLDVIFEILSACVCMYMFMYMYMICALTAGKNKTYTI